MAARMSGGDRLFGCSVKRGLAKLWADESPDRSLRALSARLLAVFLAAFVFAVITPICEASLASLGYTVLRWLDRGEIVHHDLWVEVDPDRMLARFADDVTFVSGGNSDLYVLFGSDVSLDRVIDAEGREVAYSRTQTLISLPFAIYQVSSPRVKRGETFRLRFEWSISRETVRRIDPFVALRFFYVGYDSLWYPNMPSEEFFEADIRVAVPEGYTAIADGELLAVERMEDGRWRYHFRTPVPVMALGLGVGRFRALEPLVASGGDGDKIEIQAWQPVGWISSVERAAAYTAAAAEFFTRRLGSLPVHRFYVAQVPFAGGASYASLLGHVYGGDLSLLGLGDVPALQGGLNGGSSNLSAAPVNPSSTDDLPLAFLVAHEAAHKWIGGVVGTRLVGSAWLSEGLAEYLGYLALGEMVGPEAGTAFLIERAQRPFVERVQGRNRALAAIELFDADQEFVYQKGALVFRMLHRRLGDDAFFRLIRSFIAGHRGRIVTGQDFIDHAIEFVSGGIGGTGAVGDGRSIRQEPLGQQGRGEPGGTELVLRPPAGGTSPEEIRLFFEQWVKGTQTLDYALRVLEAGHRRMVLRVDPVGRLVEPGPVSVAVELEDGSQVVESVQLAETVTLELPGRPVAAQLDPEVWLADANPADNWWRASAP